MKHLIFFIFGCLMGLNIYANQQEQYSNKFDSAIKLLEINNDSIIVSHSMKLPSDKKSNSFLGALIGALLSGLIALGIYKLGEQHNKNKLRVEKDELGEAINALIESAHKTSVKQVEEYKEYIKLIDFAPSIAHTMKKYPSHNLKRLRDFDSVEIYRIFKYLKFDKSLYNMYLDNVDFLYEISKSIDKDYKENNKDYVTELSNEFLRISQEILSDSADHLKELSLKSQDKSEIYNFINELILTYYEMPEELDIPNIKYDYENFIKPLKIEMLIKYPFDSFSKQITSKTKRASELYFSVISANNHMKDSLNLQIENIENATVKLEEIKKKLLQYYTS